MSPSRLGIPSPCVGPFLPGRKSGVCRVSTRSWQGPIVYRVVPPLALNLRQARPEVAMADTTRGDKRPFDIDDALREIEEAVRPWPKAALFELAELGFESPF